MNIQKQYYNGEFESYKTYTNFISFVTYHCEDTPENEAYFASLVQETLSKIQEYDQKIKEYIADEIIQLWEENIKEEDEEPMSEKEFCERLDLDIVEFYFETPDVKPEPFAEFWYDDDDMFGGHAICVEVDKNFEPINETSLQG